MRSTEEGPAAVGAGRLLDDGAFLVAQCGLVHAAPVAFGQLQCFDAGAFGLGPQTARRLRAIAGSSPAQVMPHASVTGDGAARRASAAGPGPARVQVGVDRHRR